MSEEKQEVSPNIKKMKPEELLQILQNELTLVEGNSEKARQRILDRIFDVIGQYSKLVTSQAKEITLLKDEISRLQRLCKEHNIDSSPPKIQPTKNRAERRKKERKQKKLEKKNKPKSTHK